MKIISSPLIPKAANSNGTILVLSAPDELRARDWAHEFCACSSLPFQGVEFGILGIIPPSETNDMRWNAICGIWAEKKGEDPVATIRKYLEKRILRCLLPKLDLRVYSIDSLKDSIKTRILDPNSLPISTFSSEFLADFSLTQIEPYPLEDQFTNSCNFFPLAGGVFIISKGFPIFNGYSGSFVFLQFQSLDKALAIETKIQKRLLNEIDVAQIYGFAASASCLKKDLDSSLFLNEKVKKRLEFIEDQKPISNLAYCSDFTESNEQLVDSQMDMIRNIEIVLNSFNFNALIHVWDDLLDFLGSEIED